MRTNEKRKIAIWGTGSAGIKFYNSNKNKYDIKCFYDNNPSKLGSSISGLVVEKYDKSHSLFIVIASEHWKEIYDQLYSYGLLPYKDFLYSDQCNDVPLFMSYSNLRYILMRYAPIKEYAPYIFEHKKLAVVYGNCQAEMIEKMLCMYPDFMKDYGILSIPKICNYDTDNGKLMWDELLRCDELWKSIGLFICQNIKESNRFSSDLATDLIVKKLSAECRVVKIVNMYFSGYYPGETDMFAVGSFFGSKNAKGNRYIEKMIEEGMNDTDIISCVLSDNFVEANAVIANAENSIHELYRREKYCDIKITDYIEENYKEEQLFYSPNHPNNICCCH